MAAINGAIDLILQACAGGPKTMGHLRLITGLGKQQVNSAACRGYKRGTLQRIGRKGRYKYLPAVCPAEPLVEEMAVATDGIVERALASRLPIEVVWR
jgi:predicted transcriptional regulator of viral defense system